MSLSSRSNQYGKILGDWSIRKEIGKGSKGTIVYQIVRKDKNWEEFCALKAIPIISERGSYNSLPDRRKEEYQKALLDRTTYARHEVQYMSRVRGRTNIVDYFDHNIVEWEDENEFGCDLLIRMELLHNLRSELECGRIFSEEEVIQIGKDICSALVVCHGKDILHRDIKPENIFFNDDGDYKLGDFSIARILEKCPGSHASTGVFTPEYAAPEQVTSTYDMKVDIYSLGLVLYEMTNQNKLPFAESPYVRQEDVDKRIRAKILPDPCDASPDLIKVILKACAHNPSKRYHTAQEMLDALNQISGTKPTKKQAIRAADSSEAPNPDSTPKNYTTQQALPDSVHNDSNQTPVMQQSTDSQKFSEFLQKANAGDAAAQNALGQCYYKGIGVDVDYKEAFKWFKIAIQKGNICAMYNMGLCYYYGHGVRQSYSLAAEWYQKAAHKHNSSAMNMIGECYYYGHGVTENISSAVKWYKKAADKGNTSAMKNLGDCYYHGRGVEKNYSLALEWYTKSGDVQAINRLGDCYYYGRGVKKNYSVAATCYKITAEKGNTSAMKNLGDCYYHGRGVEKNYSLAVEWYKKAADKGIAEAMNMLGDCYYDGGYGVEKNYSLAVEWYKKAVEKGIYTTMIRLGDCYYDGGYGIKKNYSLAVEWYKKAVEKGIDTAMVRAVELYKQVIYTTMIHLGDCYYDGGYGIKKNHSLAVEWYKKAADKGITEAMNRLGDCYYYGGYGVEKNYSLAVEWYKKAADEGDSLAIKKLGDYFYCGKSVSKDLVKAMDYYLQAMKKGNVEAAIKYENILTHSKISDQELLFIKGHTLDNISEQHIAKIEEHKRGKKEDIGLLASLVLSLGVIIVGVIFWFLDFSLWICFATVLGTGLIATTLFGILDPYFELSDLSDPETWKVLLLFLGMLLVITASIIAVIEGILWVGKWVFSFFS